MPNKRSLFVSWDGLIGDIAWQTVKEGHEVKYYIQNADEKEIADGFVPKIEDWRQAVEWADVVVFDDVLGMGSLAEELRRAGKLVVGGTSYTDRLEDDRATASKTIALSVNRNCGPPAWPSSRRKISLPSMTPSPTLKPIRPAT